MILINKHLTTLNRLLFIIHLTGHTAKHNVREPMTHFKTPFKKLNDKAFFLLFLYLLRGGDPTLNTM
jgi:hypothetical protein